MTTIEEPLTDSQDPARNFPAYLKVLQIMSAGNRALFVTSFVTNLLISQFPAVLAYTSKSIIDSLVAKDSSSLPIYLGAFYLALLLVQYVGQVLLVYINDNLTETSAKNIHLAIIKAAIRLEGLYYFENPDFHDRRERLERDALFIPMNLLRFLTDACSIVVTILGMMVLLFALHPLIPLLVILAGIPNVFTQKEVSSTHLRRHQRDCS